MSFTNEVKDEIIHIEYKQKDKKKILKSFLMSNLEKNAKKHETNWCIFSSFVCVLEFINNLLNTCFNFNEDFSYTKLSFGKVEKYKMILSNKIENIIKELNIFKSIDNHISKEDAIIFLVGFFLSIGSVNSPKSKTYHLEFRTKNIDVYESLCNCLNTINVEYKVFNRKNIKIVYFKKSEIISDFLKIIGAINSMFVFEDSRIQKDFKNQINRLNNLDVSNIKKIINSSIELESSIDVIFSDESKKKQLSNNELLFCEIKKNNPEMSLQDISYYFLENHNIKVSKSGLNHYARKIKKVAKN